MEITRPEQIESTGEATYCPEDNKIRLYCGRIPRDEYLYLRSVGYKSTPKQDCDFVATWSIRAEDAALAMLEDGDTIGDEDQSPEDRAADRAERFAAYRDKRRQEAGGFADAFENGPGAYGYQSQARADRAARKHERTRSRAVSQWDKAEYWQQRTEGVISNALYNTSAPVRRSRILRLEAEQRRVGDHPGYDRYRAHLERRLGYERQMLAAQGGTAAEADIVPGGRFGRFMVLKVNKSPATKLPVSVGIWGEHPYKKDENGEPLQCVRTVNIQRLGEDAYTPPTADDLEELAAKLAEIKAETQARNATKPKLINPTDEDAQRLQDHLNERARRRAGQYTTPPAPTQVLRMTQAQYSARSKGTYTSYGAEYLTAEGETTSSKYSPYVRDGRSLKHKLLCKVRIGPSGQHSLYAADSVIVLTDKPQKPLPEWAPLESEVAQ